MSTTIDDLRHGSRRLTDVDTLPWPSSEHYGNMLGAIPDNWWRWFLSQPWCDEWPRLVEYANLIVDDDE